MITESLKWIGGNMDPETVNIFRDSQSTILKWLADNMDPARVNIVREGNATSIVKV